MNDYQQMRQKMVESQILSRGIKDERILTAMRKVPRHHFVEERYRQRAYDDTPLSIGRGQTISQPYIVALMTESLNVGSASKVLEIGMGSGYQTAILWEICREVYTVERDAVLVERGRMVLNELEYSDVRIRVGDGSVGWKEFAPYDGILVTAGAPIVPQSLLTQLEPGGRLVIPVGDIRNQRLYIYEKTTEGYVEQEVCSCAFVPLIGVEGWSDNVAKTII